MLRVEKIDFSYEKKVLNNVSFELDQGKILGIVGKSGGGKTSLLKIIGGYLTPDSGDIFILNEKQKKANELLIPGYSKVALVQQDFGLDLYHTVEENIREKVLYLPRNLQDKLIGQMIDLLDLQELSQQKAIHISGGEQQRLSIARALASECDLVLLDEPFVHLDSAMRQDLFDYLLKLKTIRNTSFIIVTHNGEEILSLCDEVLYIKKGSIKRKAKPNHFYDFPRSLEEAKFFGLINSVRKGKQRILFRPNQYSLEKGRIDLNLTFDFSKKHGALYYNYFQTERGEDIILFNFDSMNDVKLVYV